MLTVVRGIITMITINASDVNLRRIVAQVWRDPHGRQARLAGLLRAVEVRAIDEGAGRDAGVLLGRAGTSDPIDATVVLVAEHGDRILTGDAADLEHLVAAAGKRVGIVAC